MDKATGTTAFMRPTNDNPTEVLLALDRELDHEVNLVLYGRAALCLGFSDAPVEFGTTQDVDGIIRLSQLPVLMEDNGFWKSPSNRCGCRTCMNSETHSKGLCRV